MRKSSMKVSLGDIAMLSYGKALPATRRVPGPYPVFGSGGIGGYHDSYLNPGPGVILGRKGSVGEVYWSEEPFFPIDTTFFVVPTAQVPLSYLYYVLEQQRFGENSSDSAVPGLNRDNAYRALVPAPDGVSLARFNKVAVRLRRMVHQAGVESGRLATIRDALLPALMSGRLTVRDAEAAVESTVGGDTTEPEAQANGTLW
jgi:type I restriction enzyme S subunit